MKKQKTTGIKFVGFGSKLGEDVIKNKEIEKMLKLPSGWIYKRTGILKRRRVLKENTLSLAVKSAKKALKEADVSPDKISLLILSTTSSSYTLPPLSYLLANSLKIKNSINIDINAASCGFLQSLYLSSVYLKDAPSMVCLIVCSEVLSNIINIKDKDTSVLFGDGAGACVVQGVKKKKVILYLKQNLLFGNQYIVQRMSI
jgi:3-oxoacyl-[acyl-carrier-protein] synthase-3